MSRYVFRRPSFVPYTPRVWPAWYVPTAFDQSITSITGISSAEAFGSLTLTSVATISPSSIASLEDFGSVTLSSVASILPSGIASVEAFGSHTLTPGEVSISPSGISSAEVFGSATLSAYSGIANFFGEDTPSFYGADAAVNLGTAFRVLADGLILGARFYKSEDNTGVHIARLYLEGDPTVLAEVEFQDETSSGWQEQLFDSPYLVEKNQAYIIAISFYNGFYAQELDYWIRVGGTVRGPDIGAIYNYEEQGSNTNDDTPITFGTRITVDQETVISGAQYWRGNVASGIGTRSLTAKLWTNEGVELATSDARTVSLDPGPIAISFNEPFTMEAGTTYVVSVHDTRGSYFVIGSHFDGGGISSRGLNYLEDGVDGPNGCFIYSSDVDDFPAFDFNSSFYNVEPLTNISPYYPLDGGVFSVYSYDDDGDAYPDTVSETNYFIDAIFAVQSSDEDQSVEASGVASTEAFGSHTLTPGTVSILPSGIASAEAFGSATLTSLYTLLPSGIASGETFGNATLTPGGVSITISGIASAEAFGDTVVAAGGSAITNAGAIDSLESFGSVTLTAVASLSPSSIASLENFGSTTLTSVSALIVSGIASAEQMGSPVVAAGGVSILVASIGSQEAFGTVSFVYDQSLIVSPIGSSEAFGTLRIAFEGEVVLEGMFGGVGFFGTLGRENMFGSTGFFDSQGFNT